MSKSVITCLLQSLKSLYKDDINNLELKKKVEDIKTAYPQIISDAEPTSAN